MYTKSRQGISDGISDAIDSIFDLYDMAFNGVFYDEARRRSHVGRALDAVIFLEKMGLKKPAEWVEDATSILNYILMKRVKNDHDGLLKANGLLGHLIDYRDGIADTLDFT